MSNRKILITNDDGIHSDGLLRLARAAKKFGEVWVVAPKEQRSAASHSITLHDVIEIWSYSEFPVEGVTAYACSGTPADCVRVGSLGILPWKPNIVLSGINYGYNCASDIQYSATCGAAFEAVFQGIPAIAFSEEACDCHEVTDAYIEQILSELIDLPFEEGVIRNVNFPGCNLSECKGVLKDRKISRGMFFRDTYMKDTHSEEEKLRFMVVGNPSTECEKGTDMRAVLEKYISIGNVSNIGY